MDDEGVWDRFDVKPSVIASVNLESFYFMVDEEKIGDSGAAEGMEKEAASASSYYILLFNLMPLLRPEDVISQFKSRDSLESFIRIDKLCYSKTMAKHHPDLIMCRKQPGIAIGRLCEKDDGKCVVCDSYVRPCTLVRICDECNYGSFQGRCVICGGVGISDAYYCKECTLQEKDRDGCPKIVNLGSAKTDLFYERKKYEVMAKHHPDLIMCRKQPGIAIGRLCEKCDGKCVICDSYVRPCTLVRVCDECNYGSFQGRCVICGGVGISDAYYCKECTQQEKDRDGCPKIVNLGSAKTDLFYERKKYGFKKR
ncbi:hypothetical protein RJ639_032885 [Escallonia herrerae]|uniref:PHD finger-like domain-containing protein 5A n=1 Tax=Escallonia herrerae TaxID=1293975 RepID=A0AA89BBA0_9ASTE|nr:hypothetical protein RJ639_032885 [Escallonia herrerae]